MDVLTLIPIKSFQKGKSRLRKSFPDNYEILDNLISEMFFQVISSVKPFTDFGVITPDISIIEMANNLGAKFTYQDSAADLNHSLKKSIDSLLLEDFSSNWSNILILMADLPLINKNYFQIYVKKLEHYDLSILPANSILTGHTGTSGLFFNKYIWKKIKLEFGYNSFKKYIRQIDLLNIPYYVHESDLGFDLDSIDDIWYLRKNYPLVFKDILQKLCPNIDIN